MSEHKFFEPDDQYEPRSDFPRDHTDPDQVPDATYDGVTADDAPDESDIDDNAFPEFADVDVAQVTERFTETRVRRLPEPNGEWSPQAFDEPPLQGEKLAAYRARFREVVKKKITENTDLFSPNGLASRSLVLETYTTNGVIHSVLDLPHGAVRTQRLDDRRTARKYDLVTQDRGISWDRPPAVDQKLLPAQGQVSNQLWKTLHADLLEKATQDNGPGRPADVGEQQAEQLLTLLENGQTATPSYAQISAVVLNLTKATKLGDEPWSYTGTVEAVPDFEQLVDDFIQSDAARFGNIIDVKGEQLTQRAGVMEQNGVQVPYITIGASYVADKLHAPPPIRVPDGHPAPTIVSACTFSPVQVEDPANPGMLIKRMQVTREIYSLTSEGKVLHAPRKSSSFIEREEVLRLRHYLHNPRFFKDT